MLTARPYQGMQSPGGYAVFMRRAAVWYPAQPAYSAPYAAVTSRPAEQLMLTFVLPPSPGQLGSF